MNQDCLSITPPPELVQQWFLSAKAMPVDQWVTDVATQAARWGADMELECCVKWLKGEAMTKMWNTVAELASELHDSRRPKPPSLKEQAKFAAAVLRSPDETCSIAELQQHWHTICKALEQLND